jgi:hypothetical protein
MAHCHLANDVNAKSEGNQLLFVCLFNMRRAGQETPFNKNENTKNLSFVHADQKHKA